MSKMKVNDIYIFSLILVTTIIVRYFGFKYLSDSDESIYLSAAIQLKSFLLPYVGVSDNTKGPLLYIINSFLYYLSGETIQGFRLVGSIFVALTSFVIFKIIEAFSLTFYALFWSIVYIFLVTYLYTPGYLFLVAHVVNLFVVLAYFFFLKKNFFFIGLFLGLASITKQSYIIVSILIFFYTIALHYNHKKKLIYFILGGLLPLFIICLLYFFNGELTLFLNNNFFLLKIVSCALFADVTCYIYNNPSNLKFILEFPYLLMTILNLKYLTYSTFVTLLIFFVIFFNLKFFFITNNLDNKLYESLTKGRIFILAILISIAFHPIYVPHHIAEIVPFLTIFLSFIFIRKKLFYSIIFFLPILFLPIEFYFNKKGNFFNPLNFQLDKYFKDNNLYQKKVFIGPRVSHGLEAIINYKLINITNYTYPEKIFSITSMREYYGPDFNYNNFFSNIINSKVELIIINKPINEFLLFFEIDNYLIESFNDKYYLEVFYEGKIYNRYIKNFYKKDYFIVKTYIYKINFDAINK
jgi:hypothetical protein